LGPLRANRAGNGPPSPSKLSLSSGFTTLRSGKAAAAQVGDRNWNWEKKTYVRLEGYSNTNLDQAWLPLLINRFCRFMILSIFLPAQLQLNLRSPCTATSRGSSSSAHPYSQTPFKCCSGSSPSPHPSLSPDFGPRSYWLLTPCPYLPSLMNLINSTLQGRSQTHKLLFFQTPRPNLHVSDTEMLWATLA
jgi:hypothetical protein